MCPQFVEIADFAITEEGVKGCLALPLHQDHDLSRRDGRRGLDRSRETPESDHPPAVALNCGARFSRVRPVVVVSGEVEQIECVDGRDAQTLFAQRGLSGMGGTGLEPVTPCL